MRKSQKSQTPKKNKNLVNKSPESIKLYLIIIVFELPNINES
jgi:hypothetical protein